MVLGLVPAVLVDRVHGVSLRWRCLHAPRPFFDSVPFYTVRECPAGEGGLGVRDVADNPPLSFLPGVTTNFRAPLCNGSRTARAAVAQRRAGMQS